MFRSSSGNLQDTVVYMQHMILSLYESSSTGHHELS